MKTVIIRYSLIPNSTAVKLLKAIAAALETKIVFHRYMKEV